MVVDVLYEGLEVAKAAEAREQDGGLFVTLASPMPVGTKLTLRGLPGSGNQVARVEKVNETAGSSGVLVRMLDGQMAHGPPPEAEPPRKKRKGGKSAERH